MGKLDSAFSSCCCVAYRFISSSTERPGVKLSVAVVACSATSTIDCVAFGAASPVSYVRWRGLPSSASSTPATRPVPEYLSTRLTQSVRQLSAASSACLIFRHKRLSERPGWQVDPRVGRRVEERWNVAPCRERAAHQLQLLRYTGPAVALHRGTAGIKPSASVT